MEWWLLIRSADSNSNKDVRSYDNKANDKVEEYF